MNAWISLIGVIGLILFVLLGAGAVNLTFLFGVLIPYVAFAIFLVGIAYRVVLWARSPVPFRIPTTSGQQKSLPWIKSARFDNPHNTFGVIVRMALEIFFFRSLFRNTKVEITEDGKIAYGSNKFLWIGALAFHWCFLVIVIRHWRFFTEPVPFFVNLLQGVDGFLQIGVPIYYLTSLIILGALGYLLARRIIYPQIRYISLASDYFALFLLLGVVGSGIYMRHITKVDVVKVKELALGLTSFHFTVPEGIGVIFYVHLFLVSVLLAYFPVSKLMHGAGVFLSPTRNLANNNRVARHINPWDRPVKVHTYEEWEDEFRDVIKAAGLPLERE